MKYLGDFAAGATVRFLFNTNGADGASITRSADGTIQVYKDLGTTQDTGDITTVEDFDGLTGVHSVSIDTSVDTTFYAAGHDYAVVLSGATIDGKTVNAVLAEFSIENRHLNVTAANANKIADHVLRRTQANVEASSDGDALSFRSLYGAAAKLVNKVSISGSTLTVTQSDDVTSLGTQALTTSSSADPITGADTA